MVLSLPKKVLPLVLDKIADLIRFKIAGMFWYWWVSIVILNNAWLVEKYKYKYKWDYKWFEYFSFDELQTTLTIRYISNWKYKRHLNKSNKMMNIKDVTGLVKRAINCIIIVITNCYQTIVSKAFYLITTNTKIFFSVSWYLVNSLNIR